ncbi:unnamed protein product [Coffea canephora]|uniref:Uncharacterized protein n=1 Tax=Coffea canephora TaxID=49390 RepID=A0A068V3S6_COFCA|nr:unnamed protein product [Coffea canephora]
MMVCLLGKGFLALNRSIRALPKETLPPPLYGDNLVFLYMKSYAFQHKLLSQSDGANTLVQGYYKVDGRDAMINGLCRRSKFLCRRGTIQC